MKKYILLLILMVSAFFTKAQDPQFTQFYSNPLFQAPSFAGAVKGFRVGFNYRDQWPVMPGKLTTTTFSVDYNLSSMNSGLGVLVMRDRAGSSVYTNQGVSFLYAYNVMINHRMYFRPGLGFSYSQRYMDLSLLEFASELYPGVIAPITPDQLRTVNNFDASISALFLSRNFWAGIVADHLMTPDISVYDQADKLPVKYSIFAGIKTFKFERLMGTKRQSLTFAGNYRQQGLFKQFDFGVYWHYAPLVLGVWYRDLPFIEDYSKRDALALLAGYQYEDLNIGYSYDFTLSRLIGTTGGTHEISLMYKFEVTLKKKFRPIPCPEF